MTHQGTERAAELTAEDVLAPRSRKPDCKAHLLGGRKVDDFTIDRDCDIGRACLLWTDAASVIAASQARSY